VLEGSFRREGNMIRVSADLVSTRDGFHIWSETFERELQGVFAVQDEITHAIVEALKIKLAVAPVPRPQQNTDAYDLYLQGLFFSNKSREEDLRKSLDFFNAPLRRTPSCRGRGLELPRTGSGWQMLISNRLMLIRKLKQRHKTPWPSMSATPRRTLISEKSNVCWI